MKKSIIINWLYDKKKKAYKYYIQVYPFDKTVVYLATEKRLEMKGLTSNDLMDMMEDNYSYYKDVNKILEMIDDYLYKE